MGGAMSSSVTFRRQMRPSAVACRGQPRRQGEPPQACRDGLDRHRPSRFQQRERHQVREADVVLREGRLEIRMWNAQPVTVAVSGSDGAIGLVHGV